MEFAIIFTFYRLVVAIIKEGSTQFFEYTGFENTIVDSIAEYLDEKRIPFYEEKSITEYNYFLYDMWTEKIKWRRDCWHMDWFICDPMPLPARNFHIMCAEQDAMRRRKEYSQAVCGTEYRTWLEERAQFYNNGFYEVFQKLPPFSCRPTVDSVSEYLGVRLYKFDRKFEGKHTYDWNGIRAHSYGRENGFVIKRGSSFLVSGGGWEESGGSDGLVDYSIREEFPTLEKALAFLKKRGAEIEKL